MASGSNTKGKHSAEKQTKDAPRQSLKRRSHQGLQDTNTTTLFKHLSLPTDRRPLLTLSPSPEPFPAPKRHKSIRNLRSPSPASDSDQASDADGSGTPPVTAGLVVPSGDDVSASNELSQSIVDLALQDGRTATVTDHAVATIPAGMIVTAPSRLL
ncbi:hypothetical protein JCM24511_08177 [Saitozyma sp. JCM 24511]|nr:hypothetical protein JCM24511_08177 [Saitozyma sp. JCM 24511]